MFYDILKITDKTTITLNLLLVSFSYIFLAPVERIQETFSSQRPYYTFFFIYRQKFKLFTPQHSHGNLLV